MLSLNCRNTKLEIHENRLVMFNRNVYFSEIISLHTKNDENSSLFLLKIKLDDSVVLEFASMYLRDLIKNIILDRMKILDELKGKVLECNPDFKKAFKSVKGILDENSFVKMYTKGTYNTMILNLFSWSKKTEEITNENFFRIFNQTLLEIFISMNCSVEQFYNLLTTSYFYNIKNAKNTLDRLLNENIREKNLKMIDSHKDESQKTSTNLEYSLNYATRINSYSLLNLPESVEYNVDVKPRISKPVEFEPECPYLDADSAAEKIQKAQRSSLKAHVLFGMNGLKAELDITNQQDTCNIPFEKSDFEAAKELCKLAFLNQNEEIFKFSSRFVQLIEGKYGKDALKYVERLIPDFYKK